MKTTSSSPMRSLRLWWACWRQALRRDLQFRSQVGATVVTTVIELGLSLLPALVLVNSAAGRSEWTSGLAMAVVGAYGIAAALIDTFIGPNLTRVDGYVREGGLDQILVRPVNSWWFSAARWVQPASLSGVVTGGALLAVGLHQAGVRPSWGGGLLLIAWLLVGVVGFGLFWANLTYLAFWMTSVDPVNEVAAGVRSAGQYPRAFLGRGARLVFTTVAPVTLLASVPVEALLGQVDTAWLAVALAGILAGGLATWGHWQWGLRRYESASS